MSVQTPQYIDNFSDIKFWFFSNHLVEFKFYQHIDKLTWKFVYSWIYDKFYVADLSVCHAEIGHMYTVLNQNMKICVNPNLTPCLY